MACFGLVPRGLYGLVAGTAQSWFSHRRPGNDYSRDRSRSEQVGQLYSFGGNRPERAWSQTFRKTLVEHAKPLSECGPDELWRGLLRLELEHLEQVETLLGEVETRLDQLGRADQRVRLVQTIPDVGPRTAEAIVTAITAVSRRLLVIAWAMLRDGRPEKKLLSPPESTGEE